MCCSTSSWTRRWLDVRGAEYRKLDMNAINRDGLQYHPDRREIVMFNAEHRNGEMLMAHRYILRPEHGKATLGRRWARSRASTSAGRMVGLPVEGRMIKLASLKPIAPTAALAEQHAVRRHRQGHRARRNRQPGLDHVLRCDWPGHRPHLHR